jgi:hypothetical protein
MCNQLVAFGMRRRARVRYKDRIPMLTVLDFECGPMSSRITEYWKDCLVLRDPIQRKQLAGLCIEKCKLTICIAELMSAHFKTRSLVLPRGEGTMPMLVPKHAADTRNHLLPHQRILDEWTHKLPPMYQYNSATSLSGYESPVMIVHKAVLKMLYLVAVCTLQCPSILPISPAPEILSFALEASKIMNGDSRLTLHQIGGEILQIAMDLQALNLIEDLPSSSLSAVLASMFIFLVAIPSSSDVINTDLCQQLSAGASILRELCVNYPVVEPSLKFFEYTASLHGVFLHPSSAPNVHMDLPTTFSHARTKEALVERSSQVSTPFSGCSRIYNSDHYTPDVVVTGSNRSVETGYSEYQDITTAQSNNTFSGSLELTGTPKNTDSVFTSDLGPFDIDDLDTMWSGS